MIKRFVSLKGQPIHKGHCYLIRKMLDDYEVGDELIIGIVNPYPLERMDLSRNRRPVNFNPSRNPLTYYERGYLLRQYLTSLSSEYDHQITSNILITPYFVQTIHPLSLMYNYLDVKGNCIEYISNKDEFELGKKKELEAIGIKVKFVNALKDSRGEYLGANRIRDNICNNIDVQDSLDPIIFKIMQDKSMFNIIRERVLEITLNKVF